jgi:hypothetical protein
MNDLQARAGMFFFGAFCGLMIAAIGMIGGCP